MLVRWVNINLIKFLIKAHLCDGFFYCFFLWVLYRNHRGSKLARMQKTKNQDFIKIANLSSDFKVSATTQDKNRLNKIIKNRQFYSTCELYIFVDMNIKETLYKNFKSLLDLRNHFKTNEDCIKFLEELLWEGEPVSP